MTRNTLVRLFYYTRALNQKEVSRTGNGLLQLMRARSDFVNLHVTSAACPSKLWSLLGVYVHIRNCFCVPV